MNNELIRPEQAHTINNTVYGTLKVGPSSPKNLTTPRAFEYAKEQGGKLQTLGQALVTRVAFYNKNEVDKLGLDKSEEYQKTSTLSLRFRKDGSYFVAFADLPTDKKSIALAQAGYDTNNNGKELVAPIKDAFICDLVAQAKDAGRVAPALTERPLKLATKQTDGKSAYGQHPNTIALFGNAELAELNANYLSQRGYKEGCVWDFTAKELEKHLAGEDSVLVRPVGLGGVGYGGIYYVVSAGDVFDYDGRARSVVHVGAQKISKGNEGRRKVRK